MIRVAASNIVIPHSSRNEHLTDTIKHIQQFFRSIPHMIDQFWSNARHISHNYKWCKIVLLRHNIPLDIFEYMKPYLTHGELHVPSQINNYYITTRSKLYRMGYIDDSIMDFVNEMFIKKRIPYITEPYPSYYYYHPHFSITLFIQTLAMLMGSNRHLEPLLVMRYWL